MESKQNPLSKKSTLPSEIDETAATLTEEKIHAAPEAALLSEDTYELAEAIEADNIQSVLRLMRTKPNLNVLIPMDVERVEAEASYTPLGIAVYRLNLDITKILLENGADPNLHQSKNRSIVEMLMWSIHHTDMSVLMLGQPQPMQLFGKKIPFKSKVILTPEKIDRAHKILDMLMCYGLKPDFEWTEQFDNSVKELTEMLQLRHQASIKQKNRWLNFDTALQIGVKAGVTRTLLSAAAKKVFWVREQVRDLKDPSVRHIPAYIASLSLIKQKIADTSDRVKLEKDDLLQSYRTGMINITGLPMVIINLVIHYVASSFSAEVVAKRQKENRTLTFWTQPDEKKQIEQDSKKLYQYDKYDIATYHLRGPIGETARKILIEYLLEPDEPIESLRNTPGSLYPKK